LLIYIQQRWSVTVASLSLLICVNHLLIIKNSSINVGFKSICAERHLQHKHRIWTENMIIYQTRRNKMIKTRKLQQLSAWSKSALICNRRKPIAAYLCLSFSYHQEPSINVGFNSVCAERHLYHKHGIWTENMIIYQTCQNKMIKTRKLLKEASADLQPSQAYRCLSVLIIFLLSRTQV
jgi:hypothetical protein